MSYYIAWRMSGIGEKPRWVIVDEDGKIANKNPTREELKGLEYEVYIRNIVSRHRQHNSTDTCDNIKDDGNKCKDKLVPNKSYREYDKNGKDTGRWLCANCYAKDYQKNNPNSSCNTIKSMSDRRTGNQDPDSNQAKGDLFQELTCIWRSTVSTIPVEDLNKKLDNYKSPIDHSHDSELGTIQTKGKFYDSKNRIWYFNIIHENNQIVKGFKFDDVICYCTNKDGTLIERLYIFPEKEITKRSGICITKNPTDSHGNPIIPWYEQYRIKDEDILRKVNDIWKEIISERDHKLK